MKRKKNRKLSIGKITLAKLSTVSGAGYRRFSDVTKCSNTCSKEDKPCTIPTAGVEQCGDTNTNAW